ncbi:HNH endonuclease [Providencia heimbachae]|uniref:HNH endonuclease n=1 Tax=Providencia heimbachae TaxID=333962 RepID=UPI00223F3D8B|nr:HNH endonuclease [Providencia heimbachae]
MTDKTGGEENVKWRSVSEFEGIEVSSNGDIRTWIDRRRRNPILSKPRTLKASKDPFGYRIICLRNRNGKKITRRMCRLVLIAFSGESKKGMQACHGNNIKSDDRVANLRWGTASENTNDQVIHGVHRGLWSRGENHPCHKLKLNQVIEIKKLIAKGEKTINIANMFNVPRTTINSIKVGVSWKHADAMLKARG